MMEEKDKPKTKTTKRKYTRKTPVKKESEKTEPEVKEEELAETPVPEPNDISAAEPEELGQVFIDEIPAAVGKRKKQRVITTGELKPAHNLPNKPKPHNPEDDVMITTADFKPRKWKGVKKL